jgi:hypothetical protein
MRRGVLAWGGRTERLGIPPEKTKPDPLSAYPAPLGWSAPYPPASTPLYSFRYAVSCVTY